MPASHADALDQLPIQGFLTQLKPHMLAEVPAA